MGLLERLKLRLRPPRLEDPLFGQVVFMYIPNAPQKSYWEAEWKFPPLGYEVSIGLPGGQSGPTQAGRAFYVSRSEQFERILGLARPQLDAVCRQWLGRPLADDIWADVKLAGFGVGELSETPLSWDVSFETLGKPWLGITIPMVGEDAQEAVVDT